MDMGGAERPPQAPPSARGATTGPTTEAGKTFRRTIHETIAKATQDIERDFHFNTAISAVMELVNALYAFEAASHDGMPAAERAALLREAVETTLLLLGPIAPHVTEELWSHLGHTESLFARPWPAADPGALVRKEVTLVVQVDGKVRGRLTIDIDAAEDRVQRLALADERVQPWVRERAIERVVVVANRLVNIVTRA
jgi:leucyl-tRNA synthetase